MIHRLTLTWCGLEVDCRLEIEADYHSPRSTEDCHQGHADLEIESARYADVGEFLREYFDYLDKPEKLPARWIPECPEPGKFVHPRVLEWVRENYDAVLDNALEEVQS